MLTEAYVTIDENGKWYVRRDFDSAAHVADDADYQREEETGIPAHVGWQLHLGNTQSVIAGFSEIAEMLRLSYDWAGCEFMAAFARLVGRNTWRTMITVKREGDYLIFSRDGVEFYDSAIPSPADTGRFIRHMTDKTWFCAVRADTIKIIEAHHA